MHHQINSNLQHQHHHENTNLLHTAAATTAINSSHNVNQLCTAATADKYDLNRNQLILGQHQQQQQQQLQHSNHHHTAMTYDLINGINNHLTIDSNSTSAHNNNNNNNNPAAAPLSNGNFLTNNPSLLATKLALHQQNLVNVQHVRSNSNSNAMDITSAPSSVVNNNGLANYPVNNNNINNFNNNIGDLNGHSKLGQLKSNHVNYSANLAQATNFNGNNNGRLVVYFL
jgi:hypothetical protein